MAGGESKTALVTGASSGIGFGVAQALLERGWSVVMNARDHGRLHDAAARLGDAERIATVAGSIADTDTGGAMARIATERFGSIDALVNCAGTFAPKPFLDVTRADLDHYIDGNLKGTYLVTQAVVRAIIAAGHPASIVNIGTVMVEHAMASIAASAPLASKGGIHALTVLLAAELAPHDIRVNAVAPGFIRTPLLSDEAVESLAGIALAERVGTVADTTSAILYLLDAEYVTGHVLNVDGGYVTVRH